MTELAKRKEEPLVVPKFFLAFFTEDKSLLICKKDNVLDETPLRDFLTNPVWPIDYETAVKVMVSFNENKKEATSEGLVIAVHGKSFFLFFIYKKINFRGDYKK